MTIIERAQASGWTIFKGTLQARGLWRAYRNEAQTDDDVTVWCESKHSAAKEALKMQQEEEIKDKLYY